MKIPMIMISTGVAAGMSAVEVLCYINLYLFLSQQNKNISTLKPSVIRSRNRINAIRCCFINLISLLSQNTPVCLVEDCLDPELSLQLIPHIYNLTVKPKTLNLTIQLWNQEQIIVLLDPKEYNLRSNVLTERQDYSLKVSEFFPITDWIINTQIWSKVTSVVLRNMERKFLSRFCH